MKYINFLVKLLNDQANDGTLCCPSGRNKEVTTKSKDMNVGILLSNSPSQNVPSLPVHCPASVTSLRNRDSTDSVIALTTSPGSSCYGDTDSEETLDAQHSSVVKMNIGGGVMEKMREQIQSVLGSGYQR